MYLTGKEDHNASTIITLSASICPYWNQESAYCSAAVMAVAIDDRRKTLYCGTEAYDCCAIFLAKMLRQS